LKNRKTRRLSHGVVEEQTAEVRDRPHLLGRFPWHRRRAETLAQEGLIDPLTGLRNQRALWRDLSRRSRSCSASRPLAVLMLDLDLLREINAAYGHDMGDAVLKRAASAVRAAAPSPRAAFRYGGEEFVVLTQTTNGQARELAERIRLEIAGQNGAIPAITVSCGIAELDEPVEPWVALDRADSALRDAKRSGRNRVAVAGHTSPGERVVLVEELERETARRAAMALAVATLEVRDTGTAEHSDDVLTLCEAVGCRLGFDDEALQQLMAGAQLHDVGKVAIPSAILNKPGALTEDEWAVIREHTVIGERILRSVPEMAEVATIVRHSHEHWDGSGYPDGIAGEDIPLPSRVILCADAFHAMRSDRPYRRGRPAADAIAELEACAGTQFDPEVVEALVEVSEETRTRRKAVIVSPRDRRLVALLTALVIGGGSAVAGIPQVREALRSVFGASTPHETRPSATPAEDFGFGPLHNLLVLPTAGQRSHKGGEPRAHHERNTSHGTAVKDRRRPDGSGHLFPGGGFSVPDWVPGNQGDGKVNGTRTPTPGTTTTPTPGGAPPATGGAPPPGGTGPTGPTPGPTNGNDGGGGPREQAPEPPPAKPEKPPHGNGKGNGHIKGHGNGHGNSNGNGHSKDPVPAPTEATPQAPADPPPQSGGVPDEPATGGDEPATGGDEPPKPHGNANGHGNGKDK
jgi:diguanylate cyclase (GGDEF)-like protein